ncbi:MAG: hypothetical protein KGM18_00285 [Sphingomonadales bacterium]|nr:hypothetical protein [Sphingomonadales bacterium]
MSRIAFGSAQFLVSMLPLLAAGCVSTQPQIAVRLNAERGQRIVIRGLRAYAVKEGIQVIGEARRTDPLARGEASGMQFRALGGDGALIATVALQPWQLPMRWRYPVAFQVLIKTKTPETVAKVELRCVNNIK